MKLLRSVVVALLALHLSMSQATPCRPSDYVEMKTSCINGIQTLSKLKKPHIYCTGEASIIVGLVPCSLKKASLSDRSKALLADAAGIFITDRMLYYFDKDVGVIGAGRKSLGLQAMYINGEQLGFIAYSFRDLLKSILAPISLIIYPLNGILLHDLLMGTDVYYIDQQPSLSTIDHSPEIQKPPDSFLTTKLSYIPYWNSPLSVYVEQYFVITWYGFMVYFTIGTIVTLKFHKSPAVSFASKLLVDTIARSTLTLAYFILCVYSMNNYSFKNAYWYYILCLFDSTLVIDGGSFTTRRLFTWFLLLRNEERFCNEAWLLLSINCTSSAAALWTRKRTGADVFLVTRLLEIAHVLYLFITYSSNPLIIVPLLTELSALSWVVAWIARGYLPVGICYLMCIAFYCIEFGSKIRRQSVSSNQIPSANIHTITNESDNGKIVAGRWLRDNTQKSNFTNPTKIEEKHHDSDEDSSYEESQDAYESSYDDSSRSNDEAVEISDYQIHMQTNAKCIVCSGNPRTVMVLPCRHVCFCAVCSAKLSNQFNLGYMYRFHCPVCKHGIIGLIKPIL